MKVKRVTFANKVNEAGFSGQSYDIGPMLDIDLVYVESKLCVKLTAVNRPEEPPTFAPWEFVSAIKFFTDPSVAVPEHVVEEKPAPKAKSKAA